MTRLTTCLAAALLAMLLPLAGCGLSQQYPEKTFYAISAGAQAEPGPTTRRAVAAADAPILLVQPLHVASPFDTTSFVYRVGDERFSTDYYNGLVVAPTRLVSGQLVNYLDKSGLFRSAVDVNTIITHDLTLEGNISEFYGDYADKDHPAAVISGQFFLLRDNSSGATQILMQGRYRVVQPLNDKSTAELARGLGQAWRQMLEQLTADIAATELRKTPTTDEHNAALPQPK